MSSISPAPSRAVEVKTEVRQRDRLPWIDHLRTLVIVLVVNMHACVTYSHVGGWYVMSDQEPSVGAKIPFILWQGHLQSFFMGLLFFVAGYFAHGSLARRGPAAFARERLFRLGLPTLLYMLVIHPFIMLGLNPWHSQFPPAAKWYAQFLFSGRFLGSSGPLWFALALLVFCLVLAAWRSISPSAAGPGGQIASGPPTPPSARALWLFALALGGISFAVRLAQPIGTNILNMQLCFFAQYVAAFVTGLLAAHHGWLVALASTPRARTAGWLALIFGPMVLLVVLVAGSKDGLNPFTGGWHWQALGLAFWEQLTGVGLALGLLALFSAKLNRDSRVLRWLADRSFGVYVLHPPVLVGLMMLFRALPQNPFVLCALLTATGLALSYAVADLARRVPGLRAIL
jgi:peptidoglycan/LPS O-acetylase OafA/YrhL